MEVETYPKNNKLASTETSPEKKFLANLDQSINRIVEKEEFIKFKTYKRCISTNGGNYLGELYEVDVKGITTSGDKELNIFVKNIISNEESVKIVSVADLYKTEFFFYKELSKIYEELQEGANIPLKERYKTVKIYDGTNAKTMLMENIAKKGFKTYHRMDVPSLKFLELCVTNIARFHGLSFVLKEKRTEYFNENLKSLKYPCIFNEDYRQMVKGISDITIKQIDEHLKEKVTKVYENWVEHFAKYINDETIRICLCHGDYRPNNIMMKEKDGEITEVIAIDYQVNHYGCPVFDLLYLIYFCTDRDARKAHMSHLKDLYYDTLQNFLKYFDLDSEMVYPRNEFERVFKEKLDYGLFMSVQFLPLMFVLDDEVPDIGNVTDLNFRVNDRFKERIQDIIEEFIEWGYI